jgi:hypothetical protein
VYHLLFHEVDLSRLEHACITGPMLILWYRIVEVLGGADKGRKEDAMPSAWHTWDHVSGYMHDKQLDAHPEPWEGV